MMLCIMHDPQFQDIFPFLKLIGDHFGVDWGSFQGWGSFRGRDHLGGCTDTIIAKARYTTSLPTLISTTGLSLQVWVWSMCLHNLKGCREMQATWGETTPCKMLLSSCSQDYEKQHIIFMMRCQLPYFPLGCTIM